jgi:hypothetical protein
MEGWLYDIEGNDLYLGCATVWYIRLKSLDGVRTTKIYPFRDGVQKTYEKYMEWVVSFPDGALVVGHNILGYDQWMMWKLFNIIPKVGKNGKDFIEGKHVQFVDTLYLSQYLEPDLPAHSLEYLARGSETEKLPYRQMLIEAGALQADAPKGAEFKFYHPLMDEYCDADVDANIGVFHRLWKKAQNLYSEWLHPSYRMGQKNFYLMNAQAFTGVAFDEEAAKILLENIIVQVAAIKEEVLPQLPLRPLKKGEQKAYQICAKPFKKDGSLSSHAINFIEKHKGIDKGEHVYEFYGEDYKLRGGALLNVQLPMELKDQMEFKDYLIGMGWRPTMFNLQKDENGKTMRDPVTKKVITTSPKLQEQGKLCPNLEAMEHPVIKGVVKYLSLRNRQGTLEGWLKNPRLRWDGRLSASSSGLTSTHRQKHISVCNIPKVENLLGEEFRSLFKAEDGMAFVGVDSAALENRVTASYTYKYDGGKYADLILNGDSHSYNAVAFFPVETAGFDPSSPDHDKDHPKFKKWRGKAKNGLYCLLYGGQAAKLAQTLGIPDRQGKQAFEAFWDANPALKAFRDAVTEYWKTTGKSEKLPAIDGRWLMTRSPHSLVNLICQSAGAIATDLAMIYFDGAMGGLLLDEKGRPYYSYKGCIVKRTLYQHDEMQAECTPEIADEVGRIFVECIRKAGKYLKMGVELDGEYKISTNWCGTH